MISFHAFGVRFSLPLLTLIVPFLAAKLGAVDAFAPLFIALSGHELAHLAAARLLRVEISEIRLMPFGGSAKIENPYRLPPGKLIPLAAAGPAANLLMLVLGAALAHWGWLEPRMSVSFVQVNLVLCLFNLLPALPLDGGRILYAVLEKPLGSGRALKAGIWLGRIFAAALIALFLFIALTTGKLNLSYVLAAVFIITSEPDERRAIARTHAQLLGSMLKTRNEPLPVQIYQLESKTKARCVLPLLRSHDAAWFLLTKNACPFAITDGTSVLRHMIKNSAPDATLGEMCLFHIVPAEASGAIKRGF